MKKNKKPSVLKKLLRQLPVSWLQLDRRIQQPSVRVRHFLGGVNQSKHGAKKQGKRNLERKNPFRETLPTSSGSEPEAARARLDCVMSVWWGLEAINQKKNWRYSRWHEGCCLQIWIPPNFGFSWTWKVWKTTAWYHKQGFGHRKDFYVDLNVL